METEGTEAMTPEAEAREIVNSINRHTIESEHGFNELEEKIATALRKYQSRIGELEKEVAEHKESTLDGDCQKCDYDSFTKKITALESTNSKLREALQKYGAHKSMCPANEEERCMCGLNKVLASKESEGGKPC